ncbi:MAG: FliH/SctL family protein [Bacillota bacterium]
MSRLIKSAPVDATSPFKLEIRNGFSSLDNLQAEPVFRAAAKAAEAEASLILEQARNQAAKIREETAREAESLRQEAFHRGYAEGHHAGYQKALADAAGVTEEARKVFEEAIRHRQEIFVNLQEDLVTVAVIMAEKIIRQQISLEPKLIIEICREAVKKALDGTNYFLSVHPDLLPVVEAHRQQIEQHLPRGAGMQIMPDAAIEPGGCYLETDTSVVHGRVQDQLTVLRQALQAQEEK